MISVQKAEQRTIGGTLVSNPISSRLWLGQHPRRLVAGLPCWTRRASILLRNVDPSGGQTSLDYGRRSLDSYSRRTSKLLPLVTQNTKDVESTHSTEIQDRGFGPLLPLFSSRCQMPDARMLGAAKMQSY